MPITVDRSSQIQLALINQETEPLYLAILVISSNGDISTAYPYMLEAPIDEALVSANQERILPFEFNIRKTPGQFELMLIESRKPLNKFLKAVDSSGTFQRDTITLGTPATKSVRDNQIASMSYKRARVEHVFGAWIMGMGGKLLRTVGLANAKVLWQSALNQSEVYLAQSRRSGPIAVR